MAESISEGTLRSWSKQVGDTVEVDEEVATIETDKAGISLLAPLKALILPHTRLTSVSMRLQQGRLWSCLQRRKILSALARTSS